MKRFVFDGIIRFLEYCNVVGTTFVEIRILVGVDRIDFHADVTEVLTGDFNGIANIVYVAHLRAFAGEHEDFFHACLSDVFTFSVQFFVTEAGPLDLVVRIKPTVDTVVVKSSLQKES